MSERVVHLLEPIEIDAQNGKGSAVALQFRDIAGETFRQHGAIWEPSEAVVIGEMRSASLAGDQILRRQAATPIEEGGERDQRAKQHQSWRQRLGKKLCARPRRGPCQSGGDLVAVMSEKARAASGADSTSPRSTSHLRAGSACSTRERSFVEPLAVTTIAARSVSGSAAPKLGCTSPAVST